MSCLLMTRVRDGGGGGERARGGEMEQRERLVSEKYRSGGKELAKDRKLSELKALELISELKCGVSGYPVWSVKMAMFLEATDPKYLERIYDGPRKAIKLSIAVGNEPQKMIPKEKRELTTEDISSLGKDTKVRHLLHSALENVMLNRVIGCKTAKEIWDPLEVRCQGTNAIKKNRKTILTQEYEHFDSKSDESLTDTYDRFTKMLNDLSLVDKEYDTEDSNLKFLLALPEKWDLKATIVRDNYELADMKAKEKALIIQSDSESSDSDDDDSEPGNLSEVDVDAEMMQLCALMVKGITKIAYKKFRKGKKFSRKCGSSDKKGGHISPDCKKGKGDKGQALITKKKNWADTSEYEEEVNYALMANADSSSGAAELKNDYLKIELEKEKEIIKTWTNLGKTTQNILSSGLGYKDGKSEKGTLPIKPIAMKQTEKPKDKPILVNIVLMTKKQLKHKLKEIKNVNKVKEARKIEMERKV
ncbi:hypothetical protein AgCh_028284 [Apium graveolens]